MDDLYTVSTHYQAYSTNQMMKDDERRLGTRKEVGGMTFPGEPNNAIPSDPAEYSGRSSLLLTSLYRELSKQLDHFNHVSILGSWHVGHRHTQSKPQIHVTALIEPLLTSYRPVG